MKLRIWIAFALLCFIAGSRWVLYEGFGWVQSSLPEMAVHDGLLALLCGVAAWNRRVRFSDWKKIAGFGLLMFGLPQDVFLAAEGHVSGFTWELVLMLIPVAVIFVVGQQAIGFGIDEASPRLMLPALVAIGGATLLLPLGLPPSTAGRLWLAAMVASALLAGWAAVRLHELTRRTSILAAGTAIFGASSVLEGAYCMAAWRGLPAVSRSDFSMSTIHFLFLEAPLLLLTVWLLRKIKPVSFSARLLLIPLVTLVEGLVALRMTPDWTETLGLTLMAAGTIWLLRADSREMLPTSQI